jgi:vacuolar iron transporter family protein
MPSLHHSEHHFESSETVRDIVIGMADGLTVPFALAAGLTGAVDASRLIVIAGLAEIAAGSIAMGLGGYLAARGDAEHYASERTREEREIVEKTEFERREVREILESYGLTHAESTPILTAFEANPKVWVDWMMRFELGLEEPHPGRAMNSAVTIAASYIAGGMIPLAPYMLMPQAHAALRFSVAATILALAVFGYDARP